jgi:hypothetical protein
MAKNPQKRKQSLKDALSAQDRPKWEVQAIFEHFH